MEDQQQARCGPNIAAWSAWVIIVIMTYIASAVPIVILGGLGYLSWIFKGPLAVALYYYWMPLEMLSENCPPYKEFLMFVRSLVV